jgi:hypothetical protein
MLGVFILSSMNLCVSLELRCLTLEQEGAVNSLHPRYQPTFFENKEAPREYITDSCYAAPDDSPDVTLSSTSLDCSVIGTVISTIQFRCEQGYS